MVLKCPTETKFTKKRIYFDDVLLIPAESHVLPNEVDMSVTVSKKYQIEYSYHQCKSMDTVTDSKMAIAMARTELV